MVNINVYYSTDDSYFNFTENIKRLSGDNFLYIDYGNLFYYADNKYDYYEKSDKLYFEDLFTISKNNSYKVLLQAVDNQKPTLEEIRKAKFDGEKSNLIDELLDIGTNEIEHIPDFEEYLQKHNVKFTRKFHIIKTVGYSQGDLEFVIVFKDYFQDTFTKRFNIAKLSDCIHRYFWDCPIKFRINLADKSEIYIDGFDGEYREFDKAKAIKAVMKQTKNIDVGMSRRKFKQYLLDNLPEQLEHV